MYSYNSVFINIIVTFSNWLKELYYSSMTSHVISVFASGFKNYASGSLIWNFIKRKDYFSKVWEHSKVFAMLDWLINRPLQWCKEHCGRLDEFFRASCVYKVLQVALRRFEILIAVFFAVYMVIPHSYWNNVYSTAAVVLLTGLYFVRVIIYKHEGFNLKAIDFVLFLFMLAVFLATVTSIFPKTSAKFFIFFVTCFLIVVLIVSCVRTRRALEMLITIMLTGVSLSGVYGVWQKVQVDPALTDVVINEGMPGRVFSTMGNPNNFAELLILTIPFFWAMILSSRTILGKIRYTALMMPAVIALFLTYARSSWLALAGAMLVFVFLWNRKLIPIVIILGLACIPILPQSIYRRILSIFNPHDTSGDYRVLIYKTVQPMLKDFWVTGLGIGPAPFMKIIQRYYLYTKAVPPHTHNLFLEIWIEAGIIGILSFIWFVGRMIKNCMINIFNKADERINYILMAGVASMAGIMVMGLAEYVWFYQRVMLTFWVVVGIILAGLSILASKKDMFSKS